MRDRAGLEAEAIEDIGETGRIRSPRRGSAGRGSAGRGSGGRSRRNTGDGTAQPGGAAGRRRRRTRGGREVGPGTGAEAGRGTGAAQPAAEAAERPHGEAQASASEQAPRLRRRRRTSARSGNQAEETRRKAS